MDVEVKWQGKMEFAASLPSGAHLLLNGEDGPTPMESLLVALAACTGMDVVSILEKKRQVVTSYRVEVTGDRPPQGTYPRPFTSIRVRHVLSGADLDPQAVARAVELSDEKYCSVSMTLKGSVTLHSEWVIE